MVTFGLVITEAPAPLARVKTQSVSTQLAYLPIPLSTADVATTQSLTLPLERKLPILMYHYIRINSKPKDKVGANLSVSPTNFAKQLAKIKSAGFSATTFSNLERAVPENPIILTFDDGYADAMVAATTLEDAGMRGVFYIVSDFIDKPGYLTAEQVKKLAEAGHEIGAHTVSHHELNRLGAVEQRRQIVESKVALEQLIGKPVTTFCYPVGKYNDTTLQIVKEAGYKTATTTKYGVSSGADWQQSPHLLKRVRITNATQIQSIIR